MLTPVKVCGICRSEDARLAVELGAAAIGFLFWPESPRYVDPGSARAIAATLPARVTTVGVFVDQDPAHVIEIAGIVRLRAIQLHGGEDIAPFAGMPQRIIKAIAVREDTDPSIADALPRSVTVLLDAHDPVRRGGTGRTIDWSVAAAIAERRTTILSGGLTASNVADAIARVRPEMVDVSSGVEAAPREKDPAKLREFFSAIRMAGLKAGTTEAIRMAGLTASATATASPPEPRRRRKAGASEGNR